MADEPHVPAALRQELDDLHSPPSERYRRFGARHPPARARSAGSGGFDRSQAPAFARTASRRVPLRHHRPNDPPDFDFSGRQQPPPQGAHRLANADEQQHHLHAKDAKPRASGAAITPGASLVLASGEKHLSQKYLPPTKQDAFLTNLADKSAKRSAAKPGGGTMPWTAATSSPARPQRMRASVSLLELGSAPSPTHPAVTSSSIDQTIDSTAPSAAAATQDIHVSSDTTRMLGWMQKPRAAAAAATSATRLYGKPRVDLTPKRDGAGKKRSLEPTRSSSRQLGLASVREERANSAPRRNIDVQMSLRTTSSIADSVMRRTTRQQAIAKKKKKATDGTADQPIHLDSDSDNDASPPRKRVRPPVAPSLQTKRKVRLLNPPHWKSVDLDTIKSGVTYDNAPVWIGRLRCAADVCIHDGSIWITTIRATMRPWHYMPHLQLSLRDLKGAYVYKYTDDRAPIPMPKESVKPDEHVVANHSFIALDVACSHAEDQEILRPFYDPQGSDNAKRYIVIESSDFDVHGALFQPLEDVFRAKDEALVTALEDPAAAKEYLKALIEEPYVESDLNDDDESTAGECAEATNGSSMRRPLRRSAKEKEDDDDEENFEVQLTYPLPPCSSDIVTITRSDIARLRPEQYLNDNIIDYYFKHMMLEDFAEYPYVQKNVLFLSSHFYSRLRMGKGTSVAERLEAGYKNVSTWLTRADLFSRSMVFIPINKDLHWSLAVILNPRAASVEFPDENQPPSRIAVLDPLGAYHNKQAILRNLRSFLQFEWERTHSAAAAAHANSGDDGKLSASRRRRPVVSKYNPEKVELLHVKAPQQQNSYDCGVYVLKFANVILDNYVLQSLMFGADAAISKESIDNKLEEYLTSKEFGAEKIAEMRGLIKEAIETNTLQYHAALEQQEQEQQLKEQQLKEQTSEKTGNPDKSEEEKAATEAEEHKADEVATDEVATDMEVDVEV